MKKEILRKIIAAEEDVLLLDIRETEELSDVPVIPGSVHVPMGRVFTEVGKGNLPKDKQIIVICRSGKRAAIVQRELLALGYQVTALEGGLQEYFTA